jgi:hypothetical protein
MARKKTTMKQSFTKTYQIWTKTDNGYTFAEFDTILEAVQAATGDYYLTKATDFSVTEVDPALGATAA